MKQEKEAIRTGIYIDREILSRADEAMGKTNARSRSEFISEALEFYIAWLHSGEINNELQEVSRGHNTGEKTWEGPNNRKS